MSTDAAADRLRDLLPTILRQWEDRVRDEAPAAQTREDTILHDNLEHMLEVMAKVLADQTDPRTAVRDLAFITDHGGERAAIASYSLEQMILECQILQEVVLDVVEPEEFLGHRDRSIVLKYLGEVIRLAAGEYARVQRLVQEDYAHKLERADRTKDEFLAMLAHELRNPLGAISNVAELIDLRTEDQDTLRKPVEILKRQVRHTTRLVDDLLDVSRITGGKFELRKETMDLVEALRRAAETARPKMDVHRHSFTVDLPTGPVWMDADPVRLVQVVGNLLNNAAKYTDPGGAITLSLSVQGIAAEIHIQDNGNGISPEMLPRIFNLYAQEDRSFTRSSGGLGIGLTLVKTLVEMHGGSVTASSEGPGRGSSFTIRLSVLESAVETPERPVDPLEVRSLKILLVEDNEDAAEIVADILRLFGHQVFVARDGPTAIEIALEVRPGMVLLDIGLPGMDGYEVARALRARADLAQPRLVALTGYGQEEDRLRSRDAGFDHHLVKPLDLTLLRNILAQGTLADPLVGVCL